MSPPSGDAIMDFVNELGYIEVIHFVSRKAVNNLYQPWRAILSMINKCLTGKTSGHDRPRYLVLQMLWGIITSSNVNYAELIWEEFVQALIICHLGRIHNIHQRSASPFHLAEEDFRLGNLKFVSKGEADEVFGMPIPNELISNNIRNASYYNAYLEMVAKHDQKVAAKKEGKMKTVSAKQPKSKPAIEKSSKPTPAPKPKATMERPSKASTAKPPNPKLTKEKSTKTTPPQQVDKGKIAKVHKVKSPFQLVDEPDKEPAQSEPIIELKHQEVTQPLHVVEGKGKAITPTIEVSSSGPSAQAQDDTSANIVHDTPSHVDAETGAASEKTNIGVMDEDQAGPDPGESHGALVGPDPEPTHDEFIDDLHPKVQESLKFLVDEHVILEDPISATGTLSSMKNSKDAYSIGDQFINDKSTKDEPEKPIMKAEPWVFTLELRDLPHKIDEAVCESVKEAVHVALQAPLRDRLRELPEADMKEILHQRMFKNGTYKSLLEHVALYKALEASMEWANRDEYLNKKDKSRKRQPWKKSDTQDPPPNFSKKQSDPHVEQPVKDIPMPDTANISDLEDTDSVHLPKIKQRTEWLKPIPDDERPATLEPAWVIPTSHIYDTVNNWAKALATTYQASIENSLLEKTGDMRTFMHWYYQIDWANPEGDQVRIDISKPLPLSGSLAREADRLSQFPRLKLLVILTLVLNYLYLSICGSMRHIADSSRKVVRTHMRILSVVSIKAYSRYGYDYLKETTLRIVDYQKYTITEKDFKNLYLSDFEDLNLLLLQAHLSHLSGSDKRFEYKHDYTIIESPRAVVFPVSNNKQKIMRFNEIYKFSDGTLTNIMEALDYRVKKYKDHIKMEMVSICSYKEKFITACSYVTNAFKEIMKAQAYVSKLPQL
nr:histone deacetylase 14 [Tanacetum cinerariifolium]